MLVASPFFIGSVPIICWRGPFRNQVAGCYTVWGYLWHLLSPCGRDSLPRCFLDPFYESYFLLLAALSVSDSGVEGPVAFTDRLAVEFLSAERQLNVNQVSICSSRQWFHGMLSPWCFTPMQQSAVSGRLALARTLLAYVPASLCQCVLSVCHGHCTGSQRSQLSEGTAQDWLGLSGFKFCFFRAVPRKKRLLLRLRAPKEIVFLRADEGTIVPCSLRSPALVQYLSAELQVPVPRAADQCCCLLRLCPSSQLHLLQLN